MARVLWVVGGLVLFGVLSVAVLGQEKAAPPAAATRYILAASQMQIGDVASPSAFVLDASSGELFLFQVDSPNDHKNLRVLSLGTPDNPRVAVVYAGDIRQ